MKRFVCACGMALALVAGAWTSSGPGAAPSNPTLRLTGYCDLGPRRTGGYSTRATGRGTSRFLRPEDRPYFLEHPEPPFQDPEVNGIELSTDGTRAVARIGFNLFTPVGTVSMGDPASLDLRRRGMDGRAAPEHGQPLPNGFFHRGRGYAAAPRRCGMPPLTAGQRPRMHQCPISDDGRASCCWR